MLDERQAAGHALWGKRVLVTRPRHQTAALSDALRECGAIPLELPVIEIVPAREEELYRIARSLPHYDWIVFTSVNTVAILTDALRALSKPPRVAAIGAATAAAIVALGIEVDIVPDEFVAEAALAALVEQGVAGQRILVPRADIARDTLPDGLRAAGADVTIQPVYRTRLPQQVDEETLEQVRRGDVDIITFTSPSTVRNLLRLLNGHIPEWVTIACIGPVTARAAADAGIEVDILASEYSIPGLVRALIERGNP